MGRVALFRTLAHWNNFSWQYVNANQISNTFVWRRLWMRNGNRNTTSCSEYYSSVHDTWCDIMLRVKEKYCNWPRVKNNFTPNILLWSEKHESSVLALCLKAAITKTIIVDEPALLITETKTYALGYFCGIILKFHQVRIRLRGFGPFSSFFFSVCLFPLVLN